MKCRIIINALVARILGEEMKKLEDLAKKSLATRIFDHEEYKNTIQLIFQRVNEATTSFQVCALMFISGYVYVPIGRSQIEMDISIQKTASQIQDDLKVSIEVSRLVTSTE